MVDSDHTNSTEPLYERDDSNDSEIDSLDEDCPKLKKTQKIQPKIPFQSLCSEQELSTTDGDDIPLDNSNFFPGQLVWVKSHRIRYLPWWPAVIVERPAPGKRGRRNFVEILTMTESSDDEVNLNGFRHVKIMRSIPAYRVLLFGGYKSGGSPLIDERYVVILQNYIRVYKGIDEYFDFIKECVNTSFNKVKAISAFYIPTQLQDAWELAKIQIESLFRVWKTPEGDQLSNRKKMRDVIFGNIVWNNFHRPLYDSDFETCVTSHKSKQRSRRHRIQGSGESNQDSFSSSSDDAASQSSKDIKVKIRKAIKKKTSDQCYEFEKLIERKKGECSRTLFICHICYRSGELYSNEPDVERSYVVSCPNFCGQFSHIECIGGTYLEPKKCKNCTDSFRECYICHEKELDLTLNVKEVNSLNKKQKITSRCTQQNCRRWFHEKCLQEPPWNNLMRKGRSGSIICPAHTCLSCWTENPGVLPKPYNKFIRCLKCPSAFHSGEWCIPAGSLEISNNWIICPRHRLEIIDNPSMTSILKRNNALNKSNEKSISKDNLDNFLEVTLRLMHEPTNVSWCFICSQGGHIICCETCPASFHEKCLNETNIPDRFICEDCESGKQIRYGQVIWIRLPPTLDDYLKQQRLSLKPKDLEELKKIISQKPFSELFRSEESADFTSRINWWPGEVLHPRLMPDEDDVDLAFMRPRIMTRLGFLRIRLFHFPKEGRSTNTESSSYCLWSTVYRVFPFEEDDELRHNSKIDQQDQGKPLEKEEESFVDILSSDSESDEDDPLMLNLPENQSHSTHRKKVDRDNRRNQSRFYQTAVKEAAKAWQCRNELITLARSDSSKPGYYHKIRTNNPIGDVKVWTLHDLDDIPICDCEPNSADPCGSTSDCLNRRLMYECIPAYCPNGDKCRNQRFVHREYPPQKPFSTNNGRGWGLIALADIKADDFVNEYVGDLIDEREAEQRLKQAHENSVSNYYMMQLDATRIIDAGPKGNLSRFANHSCNPNLKAQKWTVNGDIRIGLFATRDIKAGEELTFDYNFAPVGQETIICRCGSSNCTGKIGQQRALPNNASADTQSPSTDSEKSSRNKENKNRFQISLKNTKGNFKKKPIPKEVL